MHLAGIVVAVPPEHELLEQEERQDAEQQREADAVRTRISGLLERVWNEAEERGPEQRARSRFKRCNQVV